MTFLTGLIKKVLGVRQVRAYQTLSLRLPSSSRVSQPPRIPRTTRQARVDSHPPLRLAVKPIS